MNKERRKEIEAIRAELDKAQAIIDGARERLDTVKDEEQEYYDNMPESLQSGEKGERASVAVDALENAFNSLEEIDFDAIFGELDTACE